MCKPHPGTVTPHRPRIRIRVKNNRVTEVETRAGLHEGVYAPGLKQARDTAAGEIRKFTHANHDKHRFRSVISANPSIYSALNQNQRNRNDRGRVSPAPQLRYQCYRCAF